MPSYLAHVERICNPSGYIVTAVIARANLGEARNHRGLPWEFIRTMISRGTGTPQLACIPTRNVVELHILGA